MQQRQDIDDALWSELSQAFSETQLIELLMLAGFYQMVSCVVNATRLEHQDGTPRFPARTQA